MGKSSKKKGCDFIELISCLGSKWAVPVIRLLSHEKKLGFNEIINRHMREINPRSLSLTLKKLVELKVLARGNIDGRVVYSLSEEGRKIERVLASLESYVMSNNLEIMKGCECNCHSCPVFSRRDN